MKYMGSKSRIKKSIVPIIQKFIDDNNIVEYYEPFVGGANVIDSIRCEHRHGSDCMPHLIALLDGVAHGRELYSEVPKELYDKAREQYRGVKDWGFDDFQLGNIGFIASYNGRNFDGGYAKAGYEKTKKGLRYRDYYREASDNIKAQDLTGVEFTCCDYTEVRPHGAVVYLDPPYAGTKQYDIDFDFEAFWNYAREISKDNIVIISELDAPDDFKCIWQREVNRSIKSTDKRDATEKLFIHYNKENEE